MKTPEKSASKEYLGMRIYTDTMDEIRKVAKENNVKKSVIVRHALNEFLDSLRGLEDNG